MSRYVQGNRKVAFERVPEAKVVSDLRQAAQSLGEPLAINRYREQARKRGWVADTTVANRFGSWSAACRAAGIKSYPGLGRFRNSRFGKAECVRALEGCAKELGSSPTVASYAAWVQAHPEHPREVTIRYHFGGWNAALKAAGLALNKPR